VSATKKKTASAPKKKTAKNAAANAAPKKPARRADFGTPVDSFFARQSPAFKPITDALRKLVEDGLPGAESSIKWGMPFYKVKGKMCVAIGVHKAHVNLILSGDPTSFADPKGLLEESAMKGGRRLTLRSIDDLPTKEVKAWLKVVAKNAR
jgi:hypothetical protein